MNGLVERLLRRCPHTDVGDAATMREAADTILRLTAQRDELAEALRRIRDAKPSPGKNITAADLREFAEEALANLAKGRGE